MATHQVPRKEIPRKEMPREEMPRKEIPRKENGAPTLAHLKEVVTARSADSVWDIPKDGRAKRQNMHFGAGATATGWAISDRLDRVLPPHRRYLGRSRRTFLIGILILFLCILALIIGLAVGLGKGSNKPKNLPLPNGAEVYTGDLTYYDPGLGACGIASTDNDAVVAVSHYTFDAVQTGSDPNKNPLCNRKIRARRTNEKTGQAVSVDLTVIDRCTGCQPTDLDVSPAMFKQMADPDLGRVVVTWAWL